SPAPARSDAKSYAHAHGCGCIPISVPWGAISLPSGARTSAMGITWIAGAVGVTWISGSVTVAIAGAPIIVAICIAGGAAEYQERHFSPTPILPSGYSSCGTNWA